MGRAIWATDRFLGVEPKAGRPMTRTRYNAYRYLLSSLELAEFTESERALLSDAAEGFLLARCGSEELDELARTVEVTLDGVVESGRMSRWATEQARAWIDACGPVHDSVVPALA
jgi:hypothetical protein